MAISGLHHVGIYTKDMEQSIQFYSTILGFIQEWRGMVHHPTGLVDAAVMRCHDCVIELVVPVDLKKVSNTAGPIQHLALNTQNIQEVINELAEKGITFSQEGLENLPTFKNGIRHAFFYGPSGERIELVEEMKTD